MVFDTVIARLRAADRNTRLETLLDYSRKLPDLPPELQGAGEHESHRVSECQTPVFLWVGVKDGIVTLAADVPRESPTVRGFVALLISRLSGRTPADVADVPEDLLDQLGFSETLGMMRTQGLTAIVGRIKRAVAAAAN
ncbi:MAG TPA: SufE family protein [Gemmatimonadales bacterium]|jgi:cysteine desulfuration protein SufE|nr:SufE family protein [Gemmatimonadales bacterium]